MTCVLLLAIMKHDNRQPYLRISTLPFRIFLFSLLSAFLLPASATALSTGEVIALKDMQAEWGVQLGWTGSPSCFWQGIFCNDAGNVIQMCVVLFLFLFYSNFVLTYDLHSNSFSDYLTSRSLSSNSLSGTISNSIENFFTLQYLYVSFSTIILLVTFFFFR